MGEVVSPSGLPRLGRDRDDDAILDIASAGHASALVTGDTDPLTLATYGQVSIVTVADFEDIRYLNLRARTLSQSYGQDWRGSAMPPAAQTAVKSLR